MARTYDDGFEFDLVVAIPLCRLDLLGLVQLMTPPSTVGHESKRRTVCDCWLRLRVT